VAETRTAPLTEGADVLLKMIPALIGKKIGMTRVHGEKGIVVPVTVVQAGPCTVLQVRTDEKDGYHAVQMGYGDVLPHRSTKPLIGHAAKAGTGPKGVSREVRLEGPAGVAAGDVLTVEDFAESVKYVDVAGTSKGRGFTGVMARWGFGGQQATHGVKRKHRSPGSIGGHSDLARGRGVRKGKKMSGHAGHVRRTSEALELVGIDRDNNLLLIKGSVPGPNGGVLFIQKAKKKA
jgi:large subunit ribosomal protein L3